MRRTRTAVCFVTCYLSFVISAGAQTATPFEPIEGQAGKDVVWVPSSPDMVAKLMEMAKVTPADLVVDLGSGDGRNVIAAAKLGARGLGVEFNPDMVALSRRLAQDAGVADKATFVEADMYTYDISKATVMALFLLPVNMNRLAPKFFALAPGSRIVANTFGIDGWEPERRESLATNSECESWCEALLWIVPAKVQGTWTMANGTMALTQQYSRVEGTITIGRKTQPIEQPRVRGEEITFQAGGQTYRGKAVGNSIEGTVTTATGALPWTAKRQ